MIGFDSFRIKYEIGIISGSGHSLKNLFSGHPVRHDVVHGHAVEGHAAVGAHPGAVPGKDLPGIKVMYDCNVWQLCTLVLGKTGVF
jgi:hypothetical protein